MHINTLFTHSPYQLQQVKYTFAWEYDEGGPDTCTGPCFSDIKTVFLFAV